MKESFLIKIEYEKPESALARFNSFEKINRLKDEKAVAALVAYMDHKVPEKVKPEISSIGIFSFDISTDNSDVYIQIGSPDFGSATLVENLVKFVYTTAVSSLFMMDERDDDFGCYISEFVDGEYKSVYHSETPWLLKNY